MRCFWHWWAEFACRCAGKDSNNYARFSGFQNLSDVIVQYLVRFEESGKKDHGIETRP